MTDAKPVSLASLNVRAPSEAPFEFELEADDGEATGVFLSVLGDHADPVVVAVNAMMNQRRKREKVAEAKAARSRPDAVEVIPIEDDIAFGQRLAAVRLVGWRGIAEPCTPENALILCQTNPDAARQVLEASGKLANFTRRPPRP